MKRFLKSLLAIIGFILMISPATNAMAAKLDVSNTTTTIVTAAFHGVVSKVAPAPTTTIYKNGVEVEIWVDYIIKRLWKDNQFLQYAFSDDDKVLAGKIVHIPQPGSKPSVVKNRSSFPAAAVRRTDTDITYTLDEYTTDPTHIQDAEKVELSYNKIDSVYGDHAGVITETAGDDIIIKWLTGIAAPNIVKTTGASVATTLPGTTGNRKAATHKDVRAMNLLFNTQNIAKEDRYALIEENMADQIFESLSETQYRVFTEYADATTGVLGKLYGFKIMTRSSVAVASNADAIRALGASVVATDSAVSLFWQKNSVARALGEVKFFENTNDPQYYGDVYSALLRMGGRRRRSDGFGVAALIQDTPA